MAQQAIKSPLLHEVDARGFRCPLPALRLAKAVRDGGPGRYRLLADDPAANADIPALARERGWTLLAAGAGRFEIEA
jgi:tRNA 2-thiouridine synthesizing protein A